MKKILIYILFNFISVAVFSTDIITCSDYEQTILTSEGGIVTSIVDPLNPCDWTLTATPNIGYKFAYWLNIDGNKTYDSSVDFSINVSTHQNVAWQAKFVRDNAYIYKWLGDSIIFRADTTDILCGSLSNGYAETFVDNVKIDITTNSIVRKDHGIWAKPVNELVYNNANAGKHVHMIMYNSCNEPSAIIDTVIPVIVSTNKNSSELNFHSLTPNVDVHVMDGITLTINSNVSISGFLDIHAGGKVVVNDGYTLTIDSGIIMQGNGLTKKWSQLVVNGNVDNHNDNYIYYDYILDSKAYYPLSLPVNVLCRTLKNPITKNTPSFLSFNYDTEIRNTGASGWVEYDDSAVDAMYEAGKGYIIYAPGIKWKNQKALRQNTSVLRFPMQIDLSSTTETDKTVSIKNTESDDIAENDKNWNFIGNPYLANFTVGSTKDTTKIWQGYFDYVNGEYVRVNDGAGVLRYVTYSTDGFRSYEQTRLKGFTMKPFNSYFVQTSDGNSILYEVADKAVSAPKRVQNNLIKEIETGIVLSQGNNIDHTGFLFGNYTDEYEINADLSKQFGDMQPMTVYSLLENTPLAFISKSIDNITQPIRIGYRNAEMTEMTFSFDDAQYNRNDIKELWLSDMLTGKVTNLLLENYMFIPESAHDDSRFYISVVNNNSNDIATSTENKNNNTKEEYIFDILGRKTNYQNNGVYISIDTNGNYRKTIK